jgi:hypothetical protein
MDKFVIIVFLAALVVAVNLYSIHLAQVISFLTRDEDYKEETAYVSSIREQLKVHTVCTMLALIGGALVYFLGD